MGCPLLLQTLLKGEPAQHPEQKQHQREHQHQHQQQQFLTCPPALSHVRTDAIQVLLEYIYKDEVDWRASNRGRRTLPDDVMWLAHTFQLSRLASMCAVRASQSTTSFVSVGSYGGMLGG